MNTTKKELRMLTDDIIDYTFEKLKEKMKELKLELNEKIDRKIAKQTDDILIGVQKVIDRKFKEIN